MAEIEFFSENLDLIVRILKMDFFSKISRNFLQKTSKI